MKKDFMAVILGSDDNAYGFARVFYEKYNVKPIAIAVAALEASKNSNIMDLIVDTKLHKQDYLMELLANLGNKLKKEFNKIFLVPCSDSYLEMLTIGREKLTMYENRFIDIDTLRKFNDKQSFYEMCDKYKLPYPKSVICTPKDYKEKLKKIDFGYPLILKPNNSNSIEYLEADFDGKEKVYFINGEEELKEKIELVYSSSYQGVLIVQKFVSGDDTNMRVLNVYSDKSGKVQVMSLGQPILEEYHPKTYGNYASIISVKGVIPIMDSIKNFLESVHFTGASNFDIKMDAKTKEYYIFEINPRPGRSSFFTTPAGASIQEAFVEDLVYNRLKPQIGNKEEILWMNVPKVLVRKYVKNADIVKKIDALTKEDKVYHTLFYDKDAAIKRRFITILHYTRKIHYFPRYFIEKK